MRDGFRIIDADIHLIEPMEMWAEYVDPAHRDRVPQPALDGGPAWLTMDGRPLPAHADHPGRAAALKARYTSPETLAKFEERGEADMRQLIEGTTPDGMLAAMDREGVDVAIAFRTKAAHVIAFDDQHPAVAAAMCRAFNRWLADFCAEAPDRLHVGAQIPLHDPKIAAAEATYAIEHCNARTLVLPSHMVKARPYYDPDYDPLWAVAADADVAVSFHGVHASYTEPMAANRFPDNHVLGHAVGHPMELMMALGAIVTGGVLDRFPHARFAFLEGNCGWLPWWLWALDERFENWGDVGGFGQTSTPSEAFARQCYVATEVDEKFLPQVIEAVGDENLVISTDWPHDDSAYPHAIEEFFGVPISDESRRKILWDNPARLYGLG